MMIGAANISAIAADTLARLLKRKVRPISKKQISRNRKAAPEGNGGVDGLAITGAFRHRNLSSTHPIRIMITPEQFPA